MYRFLSFSLLLLCTANVISKAQSASITIQNIENEPFLLYINGMPINATPTIYARADKLENGFYWIKVVINPQTDPITIEKQIPLIGISRLSFVLHKKKGKYKVSLQSWGNFRGIFRFPPIFRVPYPSFPDIEEEVPRRAPPSIEHEPQESSSQPSPTNPYDIRVSDIEFEEIKRSMQEEPSDEEKLRIAKFSMKNIGYFSAEQVAELIDIISFEKEKLELAKFAYDYTYDRYQYYTKVSRKLKTSQARKELFEYLENK